jgi:endonuclease YncB( thermonuclease family)
MARASAFSSVAGCISLCVLASPCIADDSKTLAPCTLEPGPVGTVARVVDGETLVLDNGKAVRLIGALAPRASDAGAAPGSWPPEAEAIKALSDLVVGKRVKLAFGGRRTDRYGRLLAQVFQEEGGHDDWVQGALLEEGHARAYGLAGSFACSRELLAHEAEARRQRIGLWGNGVYRPMAADHPGALMTLRGKYERVIGSIVSIGRTKSATYLNFGSDWRTDFTARIGKNVIAADPDFAQRLVGLEGKTVVVRGWIERRNGPLIDIIDASQIEIVDGDGQPSASADAHRGTATPARAPAGSPTERDPKELRPAPTEGAEPGAVNL